MGNNIIERLFAEHLPTPFMSLLVDDCIEKARDYHDGGPRYNVTYIQGVGIGTLTDSLSAIKYHVYDEQNLSIGKLLDSITNDFEGDERTRQLLMNRTQHQDRTIPCEPSSYNSAHLLRKSHRGYTRWKTRLQPPQ